MRNAGLTSISDIGSNLAISGPEKELELVSDYNRYGISLLFRQQSYLAANGLKPNPEQRMAQLADLGLMTNLESDYPTITELGMKVATGEIPFDPNQPLPNFVGKGGVQ